MAAVNYFYLKLSCKMYGQKLAVMDLVTVCSLGQTTVIFLWYFEVTCGGKA